MCLSLYLYFEVTEEADRCYYDDKNMVISQRQHLYYHLVVYIKKKRYQVFFKKHLNLYSNH